MDNPASIMWGVIFGSIGMGYLVYGKKQRRGMALISGMALCIFPYFVSSAILIILIAIILMALPYFFRF
jgi:hypothetical protein